MADNCLISSSFDGANAWAFRPSPSDSLWALAGVDSDAALISRALQVSLSDASSSGCAPSPPPPPPPSLPAVIKPEPAPTRNSLSPSARISKRKSRASKKTPTTYITADPANFRQMVQQVTGVRFAAAADSGPSGLAESVVRPEPMRGGMGFGGGVTSGVGLLPTLDTSAGLLDRSRAVGGGFGSIGPVGGSVVGSGFEFDHGFAGSFPTLESWGAM